MSDRKYDREMADDGKPTRRDWNDNDGDYFDGGQIDPSMSLQTDDLLADELDEGVTPPLHWSTGEGWGTTANEQREGEPLDLQLWEEEPDPVLKEIGDVESRDPLTRDDDVRE
ncbi:hypothetical protein [Actinocorallia lasiicapitis]